MNKSLFFIVFLLSNVPCSAQFQSYKISEPVQQNVFVSPELAALNGEKFDVSFKSVFALDELIKIKENTDLYVSTIDFLLRRYLCLYDFKDCENFVTAEVFEYILESESALGQAFDVLHFTFESEEKYLLFSHGVFSALEVCTMDRICFGEGIENSVLEFSGENIIIKDPLYSWERHDAIFQARSEQVLMKDGYNILTIIPPKFEQVIEQVLEKEENVCPEYEVDLDTLTEQVLINYGHTELEIIPAQFETVTEQVLKSDSYAILDTFVFKVREKEIKEFLTCPEHLEWKANDFQNSCDYDKILECIDWEWLLHEETFKEVETDLYTSCPNDFQDVDQVCVKYEYIDATYKTRSYEKLVAPATTTAEIVNAEYGTRQYTRIADASQIPDSCIKVHYEERNYLKLIADTRAERKNIDATYEVRSYQQLIKNEGFETTLLENTIETSIWSKDLIYAGAENIQAQIVCERFISEELLIEIKEALRRNGFDISMDEQTNYEEFIKALTEYQIRENLVIGFITEEVLELLKISY